MHADAHVSAQSTIYQNEQLFQQYLQLVVPVFVAKLRAGKSHSLSVTLPPGFPRSACVVLCFFLYILTLTRALQDRQCLMRQTKCRWVIRPCHRCRHTVCRSAATQRLRSLARYGLGACLLSIDTPLPARCPCHCC